MIHSILNFLNSKFTFRWHAYSFRLTFFDICSSPTFEIIVSIFNERFVFKMETGLYSVEFQFVMINYIFNLTKASIAAYLVRPRPAYILAVLAFLSSALCQNSRSSLPWKGTESFWDW